MSKDKKKKKKPKVTYIDDGRTIADMSNVSGGFKGRSAGNGGKGDSFRSNGARGTLADQARTFFAAMRMMVKPMLVTMGIITVAFFVVWLLLTLAG